MDLQPTHLQNTKVKLAPLRAEDFDILFALAADPDVWNQHPNKNRYQRPDFENYFNGAIKSGGAFLIMDSKNLQAIGCTRFYNYDPQQRSILIGYTFYGKDFWGKGYNSACKQLMLDHAFQFADEIIFHVGAQNFRSQRAMQKLGAVKTGEEEIAYFGEGSKLNFIYSIKKHEWKK